MRCSILYPIFYGRNAKDDSYGIENDVRSDSDRFDWIDVARGLGISLVIFGHVVISLRDARLISVDGFWGDAIYLIYTFHMPVFMVLAGLFVWPRLECGAANFLRPMGTTIVWPYLLWGSLIIVAEWLGQDARSPVDTTAVDITLLWTPIAWLWFLWALGIFHLIAAVIGRHPLLLIVVGAAAWLIDGFTTLPGFSHRLAHFLIFYAVGVGAAPMQSAWGQLPQLCGTTYLPQPVPAQHYCFFPWHGAQRPLGLSRGRCRRQAPRSPARLRSSPPLSACGRITS